jgi:hypothetical protein
MPFNSDTNILLMETQTDEIPSPLYWAADPSEK